MNILLPIIEVPLFVIFLAWLLFGGADKAAERDFGGAAYWNAEQGTATRPQAARRCSAAQRKG